MHNSPDRHHLPLLEARNISVGYPEKPNLLRDLDFTLYARDFVGIIGPNGGGKTTLVKSILGLLPLSSGEIVFYDAEGNASSLPDIGYVPQQSTLDRSFPISVSEVVRYGLASGMHTPKGDRTHRIVEEQLERVDMLPYRSTPIGKLSGGQLQRVLLARALVSHPRLLILDEPNTYVDKHFESQLYSLLPEINKESAILLVSHDIGSVSKLVRRLFCVNHTLHVHEDIDKLCSECAESTALKYLSLVEHREV